MGNLVNFLTRFFLALLWSSAFRCSFSCSLNRFGILHVQILALRKSDAANCQRLDCILLMPRSESETGNIVLPVQKIEPVKDNSKLIDHKLAESALRRTPFRLRRGRRLLLPVNFPEATSRPAAAPSLPPRRCRGRVDTSRRDVEQCGGVVYRSATLRFGLFVTAFKVVSPF